MKYPVAAEGKKLDFKLGVSTEAQTRGLEGAGREIIDAAMRENPTSGEELHEWRRDCGNEPALYVGERQEAARAQKDLTPCELLDRAVDDLADKCPQKSGA